MRGGSAAPVVIAGRKEPSRPRLPASWLICREKRVQEFPPACPLPFRQFVNGLPRGGCNVLPEYADMAGFHFYSVKKFFVKEHGKRIRIITVIFKAEKPDKSGIIRESLPAVRRPSWLIVIARRQFVPKPQGS